MRQHSKTPSSLAKQDIQRLAREIVILRDGGCIMRDLPEFGQCNGFRGDGELILQANHLITRGKNVGYANTLLIVCMCKGHHKGFHSQREKEYRAAIGKLIGAKRRALLKRVEEDRKIYNMTASDWFKEVWALKAELEELQTTCQSLA